MICREATAADVPELVQIHMDAWRSAYRGLIPDRVLESLDDKHAMERLEPALAETPPLVLVVEDDGSILGFCRFGPSREMDVPLNTGEVFALNVEPRQWRRGCGRALMDAALERLRRSGFQVCTLWVLADNSRACSFYEALGFTLDGATRIEGANTERPPRDPLSPRTRVHRLTRACMRDHQH